MTITKKKLTPASICAQKAWGKMPLGLKKEIRKNISDKDRDGVPNGFDCRPKNRKRQEGFLPADQNYLSKNPSIELGKKIAEGGEGAVFEVKGRRHLVVKIPRSFDEVNTGRSTNDQRTRLAGSAATIEKEAFMCEDYRLNDQPLFSPTKAVKLKCNSGLTCIDDKEYTGLVRPKVTPVVDFAKSVTTRAKNRLTDKQLEVIRQKLIALSYEGFVIGDGLQIGIDFANRPLLYDMGYLERCTEEQRNFVFKENNGMWEAFLRQVDKFKYSDMVRQNSVYRSAILKYGRIERTR